MKKIFKITAAVLVVLALIFTVIYLPANAASSSTIALSSKSLKIGDALTVTVKINGGEAMYATEAYLKYDANVFRFNSGDMATGGSGSVHIVGMPGGAQSQSYGLNFTAISAGTVSFSLENVRYVGGDLTSVTGASVAGITVTDNGIKGDVNFDGVADALDAKLILNYIARTCTFTSEQKALADVNGDGKINIGDSVAVLNITH